jgi:deoxyadenosine/deoxycytidine kinase
MTVTMIAEEIGLGKSSVHTILREHLHMKNVCEKILTKLLTPCYGRPIRPSITFTFLSFYHICIMGKYFKLCNYIDTISVCKRLAGTDKNTSCYSVVFVLVLAMVLSPT